jgi:superfamily II DNA/RNA helicase
MFDDHARKLLENLPALPGLDRDECRRALSAAYSRVVEGRLHVVQGDLNEQALRETRLGLRRMVDALESVAVFDPLNGIEISRDVADASAFTAAEALSLLAMLPPVDAAADAPPAKDPLKNVGHYCRIEAGLLYLISGYDINAVAVVRDLPVYDPGPGGEYLAEATLRNAHYLVSRLHAFCAGDVRPATHPTPYTGLDEQPVRYESILLDNRLRCYEQLAIAVNTFLEWLGGGPEDLLGDAREGVERVRRATHPAKHPDFTVLADLHHLAGLVLAAFESTSERSVVHKTPPPSTDDFALGAAFQNYLQTRARGTATWYGRPFLWPSAKDFVAQCLPGPKADAVVAMPTGSGKSFVAELAIADALTRGSVIYLAPTNALVHQIRRDLREALAAFGEVDIRAFLGGGEYTAGLDDFLGASTQRFVAVMTPEKCALALRLSRPAFADLSLCVFDECHLLNEPSRGVLAEILLAQLFVAAPNMNYVLMSAMISNPEELAGWLASARGSTVAQSVIKWRPSRTLRALLGVDRVAMKTNATAALTKLTTLQQTSTKRVNYPCNVDLAMLTGLSGPWTVGAPLDYRVARLPLSFEASVSRRNATTSLEWAGWTNDAARIVAEALARSGIPVIAFILVNRHFVFTQAAQVTAALPGALEEGEAFAPVVKAWLEISKAELGVETEVRALLQRGVAVHSSAMLQTEQAASEWMFKNQRARLMFATPTLAQGLNLPAVGVVVAGTEMAGGAAAQDNDELLGVGWRTDATILNRFGRAGRPGFANQGLAILVGNKPVAISSAADAAGALLRNRVLRLPDAAVKVQSPIEQFLDRALVAGDHPFAVTEVELELTTLLAESSAEDDAGKILGRTFAAYRKRQVFTAAAAEGVRDRIASIKTEFLAQADIPAWLNLAATQSGVDVFRAQRLWEAYRRRGMLSREQAATQTVENWFAVFLGVMRELPPARIGSYLAPDAPPAPKPKTTGKKSRPAKSNVLTKMRDAVKGMRHIDTVPWNAPDEWNALWDEINVLVWSYMRGCSYASLCESYLGIPEAEVSSSRGSGKPLPSLFGFLRKVTEPLARDAGCLVALVEHSLKNGADDDFKPPESLQALPLCIRNGCDSLTSLAWFRFGYRQRICAHRLADAFPIPPEISDDDARATWVRDVRGHWLEGSHLAGPDPDGVLTAVRVVIEHTKE